MVGEACNGREDSAAQKSLHTKVSAWVASLGAAMTAAAIADAQGALLSVLGGRRASP